MAKHPLHRKVARDIQQEAEQIARGLQVPGQTREQTRLIARGIQRGIETYRRQQAEKERGLDREAKRLKRQQAVQDEPPTQVEERVVYRRRWLPWVLLAGSVVLNLYLVVSKVSISG